MTKIEANEQFDTYMDFLRRTDYVCAKIAEGEATIEDYKETIAKRKEARAKVNEALEVLGALE